MASLLQSAAKQGIARIVRRLGRRERDRHDSPVEQALIEPLSDASSTCSGCSEPT